MQLGKKSILDGLGLALAGSVAKSGEIVRRHLQSLGCAGSASVLGSSMRVPARFAAFANGVAIHADDYDDTQLAVAKDRVYGLLTHPTAPVLPAALALAERDGRSGARTVAGLSRGSRGRVQNRRGNLSPALPAWLSLDGDLRHLWFGRRLGQSLCASHGSDPDRFGHCRQSVRWTARELRHHDEAVSCRSLVGERGGGAGVRTDGIHGGALILEAGRGFFRAAGGGYDEGAIQSKLGAPWTFANPGVSIKPHPSGSLTHPGMTLMLSLIRQHHIRPEQVDQVKVGTNQNMPNALIHHRPTTELQAKFSMEFCMAILLLKGGAPDCLIHR